MNANWDGEAFDRAYEERKQSELDSLRERRRKRAQHRRNIANCNMLLIGEGITLVVLIVALILNW
ncbi:MAG: hypothetical protein IJZ25_03570 [Lachnospiraceae bacterium]|nr:hypothetical protein [Lachnospiraceae bacterium]